MHEEVEWLAHAQAPVVQQHRDQDVAQVQPLLDARTLLLARHDEPSEQ